jgi:predicted alpha/beta hydrolase
MHTDLINTTSGYAVPVRWFPAEQPRASIIFMPALGVAARFYVPLAENLHDAGFNVLLMELRGQGDSHLRASRRVDFGFRDALEDDVPAAMDWVLRKAPAAPLLLMGHSLGGHYAAMTAGRLASRVDGVILAACGSPWTKAFHGKTGAQLRMLCRLIPVLNATFGYYPGHRVGFGGREARTLMNDWLDLARTNVYSARGLDEDFDAAIGQYAGPVLSLRMADDPYAPEAAMAAVTDKFRQAVVSKHVITAEQIGDRADHFRWARKPEAVVDHILAWLPQ